MNWTLVGRGAVATLVSAALGLGTTACSRDYTVAFVYATAINGTEGLVSGYQVDYQSGALTPLANSPTSSGGRSPVYIAAVPSGKYVYVLNRDDNSIVDFAVGTDGKLYPQHTYNTTVTNSAGVSQTSSFPVAAAVDPSGAYLYVVCTFQPGFTQAATGPGDILVFPINTNDGSLSAPTQVNVGNTPIGIAATPYVTGSTTNRVYVLDRETLSTPTGSSAGGVLLTFSHAQGSAALTQVTPSTNPVLGGIYAGVFPTSISVDPTARYVYVTDALSNQLIGYNITNTGVPAAMINGPFSTGQYPYGSTVDPRGKYLYVTNYNSGSVSAYALDQATGNPAAANGSTATATQRNPTCVAIEPALGIYMYTTNQADQSISAFQLDSHNGSLKYVQGNPFPTSILPTCLVAVANGQHATQVVNLQ